MIRTFVRAPLAALLALSLGTATSAQTQDAEYLVIFDATWSQATHPIDFPGNAHFSPLIGGSHSSNAVFWAPGGLATRGMERMAETGSRSVLEQEIDAEINNGNALEVIKGSGTDSPGQASTRFMVNQSNPEVTLVTMIAPSPDWFVGVGGLSLFQNGDWVDQLTVDLLPWDAGTDSGVTYTSRDQDTQPPELISLITTDPVGNGVPLGTYTFLRCDGARWSNYGSGFAGTNGVPSLTASADPQIGTSIDLLIGNSRGAMTRGVLFFGIEDAMIPGSWGGDLLVTPLFAPFTVLVPPAGQNFTLDIPNDEELCGYSAYFQVLEFDPGAANGLSSSEGLELVIGE